MVYTAAQKHTNTNIVSTVITFDSDQKIATVILGGGTLVTGQKYKVALLDNNKTQALANVVTETDYIELLKGIEVPEVDAADSQDEFVIKYAKKMNSAAVGTPGNYKVYDSSNTEVANAITNATFVAGSGDKEVTLKVRPGALQAGKTYTIIVDNTAVKADDGTELTAAQSKFTIKTPSVSEAKPKLASTSITANNIMVLTFDKDLKTNTTVDVELLTVKKSNGDSLAITSAEIAGKNLTITMLATPFEEGKIYSVEVGANVGINDVYRNATIDAISTTVKAEENKGAEEMTAQLVRDSNEKEKVNLILKFDRAVNGFTSTAGDIVINALGDSFDIDSTVTISRYAKDTTGKSLIIEDVETYFKSSGTPIEIKDGVAYQAVAVAGKITTTTPSGSAKTNASDLKANFTGIDISAPEVETTTIVSAEKITVQFDETIDVSDLTAGDITVKGFILGLDGSSSEETLTGANQIKFTASGDTLTIMPANAQVKFKTGEFGGSNVTALVTIAKETIKDANGIENDAPYSIDSDKAKDLALPVVISAEVTDANTLAVTYSEDVDFKATDTNKEASQFEVSGVKISQSASAASINNNVLTLTFTGSFEANKDYSAAKLAYTRNINYQVRDAANNLAENVTFVGFEGF